MNGARKGYETKEGITIELVSIVVPVYNGAPYIEDSVRMIKAQTYGALEVLYVNDGSSDNSAEVCERAFAGDERFRLINKANGGTAQTRNVGLDAARGKYIMFLDVDDEYHPELVAELARTMETEQVDMAVCAFHFKVLASKAGEEDYLELKKWPASVYRDFSEMRKDYIALWDSDIFSMIWHKMFRVATLRREGIRFRDGHVYSEDGVFNRAFLAKVQNVAFIENCLYDYVRDRPGATTVVYRENLFDIRRSDYLDFIQHFQGLDFWNEQSREYTSRQFVERVANCIENVFHAENRRTEREKYRKIKEMIGHPDVREAVKYARCRSLKMRIFVLPIRWNWAAGAYIMGRLIYTIRKADPQLFHKLKERR